ncbi:Enoyl-CoA delta isomerase 1, mitochondrial [Coccomyxa sp. Obi]|nr:Enoyl-CoA delta isomerase 1, mitochondrial [Coccomyxa sp. Obi]
MAALQDLEDNQAVRGVIFASGLKRDVFTAGNDIKELYAPQTSMERYREFWVTSNVFLARLYRSPLVTIAAIKGACPAGGCCLSLCCDVRIMTEQGHIGLNEVAIGISVPLYWGRLMARIIDPKTAEHLCKFAVLLPPKEAAAVGLVDKLVPSSEELLPAAEAAMVELLKQPDSGRTIVKSRFRDEFSLEWEAYPEQEWPGAWELLASPLTVKSLEATLQRLSGKKTKSKL